EIWVQTLWDLRAAVTPPVARMLITRAMELSPDDPTYLDMRNAILQADTAFNGGHAHPQILAVVAHRRMGFRAGRIDGNDSPPVADFRLPPAGPFNSHVTGRVFDVDSHAPLHGALVGLAGVAGGPGSATTVGGHFALPPAFATRYPYLVA